MRASLFTIIAVLLCTACTSGTTAAPKNDQWFRVYQTDRTCQLIHPSHEDPFLKGPTGRAHPF